MVTMRAGENPILNLKPPSGFSSERQRKALDLVSKVNARHLEERDFDDQLLARVEAYELAFRMQAAAPDIVDLSSESATTKRL